MRAVFAVGLLLLALGCSSSPQALSDRPSSPSAPVLEQRPEPPGEHCAAGGIRLSSGTDRDRNGTLEGSEISSTAYLCDGLNGTDDPGTQLGVLRGKALRFGSEDHLGIIVRSEDGTLSATTDADGSYALTSVPAGVYALHFESAGYVAVRKANVFALNGTIDLETVILGRGERLEDESDRFVLRNYGNDGFSTLRLGGLGPLRLWSLPEPRSVEVEVDAGPFVVDQSFRWVTRRNSLGLEVVDAQTGTQRAFEPSGRHAFAFDPSGDRLVFIREDDSFWIWDLVSGRQDPLPLSGRSPQSFTFSADGRWLHFYDFSASSILDLANGTLHDARGVIKTSPDQAFVVLLDSTTPSGFTATLLRALDGTETTLTGLWSQAEFSLDSTALVLYGQGEIQRYDLARSEQVLIDRYQGPIQQREQVLFYRREGVEPAEAAAYDLIHNQTLTIGSFVPQNASFTADRQSKRLFALLEDRLSMFDIESQERVELGTGYDRCCQGLRAVQDVLFVSRGSRPGMVDLSSGEWSEILGTLSEVSPDERHALFLQNGREEPATMEIYSELYVLDLSTRRIHGIDFDVLIGPAAVSKIIGTQVVYQVHRTSGRTARNGIYLAPLAEAP